MTERTPGQEKYSETELPSMYYVGPPVKYHWQSSAGDSICVILRYSTGNYRPNDRTYWYNKTNSNFTNEVWILERTKFNNANT